ncbi:MAG: sigma-70 family RNA polymerase sigma factor [Acidobacteriota bacterium]|nr:sigma-70 family RNA polymerase sigma factor [Acidobacteriota bacterium]
MPILREIKIEDFEAEAMPHLSELYRTALRFTKNQTEAEDLIQEVFMQAWKSFGCYELGTNCRAWLHKILSNKLKRFYFNNKKFKYAEDADEALKSLVFKPAIAESLRDEEIIAGLEHIPPCFREAMLLADVEEFSYREIAEILGVPAGTVMSRISRGRKLLRTEMMNLAHAKNFKLEGEKESVSVVKFLLGKLKIA